MIGQRSRGWMERGVGRTLVRLGAATALAAGLTACGGGGGGDSSDDVDLRAAYDRINRQCMNKVDVEKAVGTEPTSAPSAGRLGWIADNQRLDVTFVRLDSGAYVVGNVDWFLIGSSSLAKEFPFSGCE